jgi:hypothetical protein
MRVQFSVAQAMATSVALTPVTGGIVARIICQLTQRRSRLDNGGAGTTWGLRQCRADLGFKLPACACTTHVSCHCPRCLVTRIRPRTQQLLAPVAWLMPPPSPTSYRPQPFWRCPGGSALANRLSRCRRRPKANKRTPGRLPFGELDATTGCLWEPAATVPESPARFFSAPRHQ